LKHRLTRIQIKFRHCGASLLLLLTLLSAAPRAVMAQQPEPSAQPSIETPAEEAKNPPHTEAAKSEEENNDQYRHAPIVESLAKLMHMDVETAARTFEIFNVSIVQRASVPVLPVHTASWYLIYGAMLGMIFSFGTAAGADRLDPTFRTLDELELTLQVPVLAALTLPVSRALSRISDPLSIVPREKSNFA